MRLISPPLFKNVGYLFHFKSKFNFILPLDHLSVYRMSVPTVQSIYNLSGWDGYGGIIPYYTWAPEHEMLSSTCQRGCDGGFSITPRSTGFDPRQEILTPLWEMYAWVGDVDDTKSHISRMSFPDKYRSVYAPLHRAT